MSQKHTSLKDAYLGEDVLPHSSQYLFSLCALLFTLLLGKLIRICDKLHSVFFLHGFVPSPRLSRRPDVQLHRLRQQVVHVVCYAHLVHIAVVATVRLEHPEIGEDKKDSAGHANQ